MARIPMADPRLRIAAAGLAVMCVIAMSVLLGHAPESRLAQETVSTNMLKEVTTTLRRCFYFAHVAFVQLETSSEATALSINHDVPGNQQLLERDESINLHVNFGPRTDQEKEYDADKEKFSEEHPAEAYRIRLKRKSMEEAALEEAYEEKVGERSFLRFKNTTQDVRHRFLNMWAVRCLVVKHNGSGMFS